MVYGCTKAPNRIAAIIIIARYYDIRYTREGFNEDFIYMNNMDTELLNRLSRKNDFYDLGLKCDGDFYHLYHSRMDGALTEDGQPHAPKTGSRKTNSDLIRRGEIPNNNPFDWGLKNEDIIVYSFNE